MSYISKLEKMVAGWLKPVPHLPHAAQKWIAENVWWIVLIGAIASGISILVSLGAIFSYSAFIGSQATYYYVVSPYGPGWLLAAIVSLILSAVIVALLATAITPLKAMKSSGWDKLFIVLLVDALSIVLSAILSFNVVSFIFTIIFGAIGLAIGSYFIFEIRSHFGAGAKHHHAAKK
jgi:hypothetical protein